MTGPKIQNAVNPAFPLGGPDLHPDYHGLTKREYMATMIFAYHRDISSAQAAVKYADMLLEELSK